MVVVSDLSGETGARTYRVSDGGRQYEVDLTEAEFAEYEAAVARFVAAGRPVAVSAPGRAPVLVSVSSGSARRSPDEVAAIKAWAQANGWDVPQRGRLSAALVEAYQKATFRSE